ncbi:YbhB/YbcL family Raf kinase inhibitor-like protein [Aromatoleum evansii]|uniref:YbhB/YbcL family Raf kinase inhibitor-like protein n=1 Tax=Aromatoleum evansii TaxID=59406 RepID=A0ABZ1ANQ8_AROEV|nr:YbhB/YbcL family Raf kinase inhibitor-like protein [Aromatoleum evansii]NMG27343.1 YbhB/YbcL family Raf kinase inhibitor-like protein [Aromatoleum evansii]WRL47504.1 YbhB/YbcL family Raf kinase inhibitor-like protein [Aromatoleum evansii]
MRLSSQSFADGARIPGEFSFCIPAAEGHVCLGSNRNPHLAWSGVPTETRSFVLICHDPDVPSSGDDVNQEGRVVPASLPRVDFFHWVVIDLPADLREIAAGSFSDGVTPGGKNGPEGPLGSRQGINDYTAWFAGDEAMRGNYHGYDGPCPPWNDELVHRYVFTLYALDKECCNVDGSFGGAQVRNAIAGHVLAEAKLTGTYTLNPSLSD